MIRSHIHFLILCGLLFTIVSGGAMPIFAADQDVVLECNGEVRSRLLAFQAGDLVTEELAAADRNIYIQIKNSKRATVMEHPSGDILFTPSQCKLSKLKIYCEYADEPNMQQMFISRTSGDAVFEGYVESSDEKSSLIVERYLCVKEQRQPLF